MLVRRATRAKGPEVGLEKGTPLTVPCTQVTTIRNTRETGLVVLTGPVSDVSRLAGTCEWVIRALAGLYVHQNVLGLVGRHGDNRGGTDRSGSGGCCTPPLIWVSGPVWADVELVGASRQRDGVVAIAIGELRTHR